MTEEDWKRETTDIPQTDDPFSFYTDKYSLNIRESTVEVAGEEKTAYIPVLRDKDTGKVREIVDISFNEYEAQESLRDYMEIHPTDEEMDEYLTAKAEMEAEKKAEDQRERAMDNQGAWRFN